MMGAVQHTMTKKTIDYINIITSNQCCLTHFSVQIDGGFIFLQINQNEETCGQPDRSYSFKLEETVNNIFLQGDKRTNMLQKSLVLKR